MTYKMYMLRGFKIVVLSGDHKFAALSELAGNLSGASNLNWMAASQHCGLIEQNSRFLKEKIRSLRHSLPFEWVPGIMVVHMVLHIIKFVNGFPCHGGVKHYSPGKIMTNCCIHANDVVLSFGVYCQIAKNVEPRNSLAPRTRGAILLGNSSSLSGGQMFLALNTGATVIRHQWVVLPMPSSVIDHVNFIGLHELSILIFTNRHGQDIGENPQDTDLDGNEDLESVVADPTGNTGVFDGDNITELDQDFAVKPTGVDIDEAFKAYVPLERAEPEDGLGHQDSSEPERLIMPPTEHSTVKPTMKVASTSIPIKNAVSLKKGMAARNARVRKQPKKYVPSMKGNKYAVTLTQIKMSFYGSEDALSMAQRSVKLMSKGLHRCADIVGMIMAQLSMKAGIKKWGEVAEQAITVEMKQLLWHNSYKPMHWHELTSAQKEKILESHIFIKEKRDGKIKARKVVGGNKQRDYISKEDVSSPTVSAEAVMLTCVIGAVERRDNAVINVPNAFVQTVVEDKEHRVIIHIRGPLVDILVSIATEVYGPYVSTNKSGQKVLLMQCLNAVYGKMVAALLYYKKFAKSLTKQGYNINPYDGCKANKIVKGNQIMICFHVNDCKISHESSKVIDDTINWLLAKR